ncbi:MAG: hypothetical protein ABEH47_04990 [Haloferacaceae archaeon]
MTASPWALELLVLAFAGGALGASVGALPSFVLAGLVVVAGETYALAARTAGVATAVDLTGAVGFGVVLGPHVAFGGGAAALAYAARRDGVPVDADGAPHPAKGVTTGLGNRPDVLAVGGAFGVVGHLVAAASGALSLPVDPVALGVVGSAVVHRLAFGYSLLGAAPRRLFDRFAVTGDGVPRPDGDGGRPAPWLPYQHRWRDVAGLGLVAGALGAYVAYLTASAFLAFGLSVVLLAALVAGVERVPVTHHVTLPASTAVLALVGGGAPTPGVVQGAVPLGTAVAVGTAFGLAGALAGEALQRALYAGAETHLDPPAASIVVTSALVALLAAVGVLPSSAWVPAP